MNESMLREKLPHIQAWISDIIKRSASDARIVATVGYPRLPAYFSGALLADAKVVVVDSVPVPPLTSLGLGDFAEFERLPLAGITYLNTFFLRRDAVSESIYFHELVHVVQWRLLGPERFLLAYADGLQRFGYSQCPLEQMAYAMQSHFDNTPAPFNAEAMVEAALAKLM